MYTQSSTSNGRIRLATWSRARWETIVPSTGTANVSPGSPLRPTRFSRPMGSLVTSLLDLTIVTGP